MAYINEITNDDQLMCVTVEPYVNRRSEKQKKLMYLWLGIIAEETGNMVADLKDEFEKRLLEPENYTGTDGKRHTRSRSCDDLTVAEFVKFLNDIEHFSLHELNCTLPHPSDLWREALVA